ncbi:MAG: hypothetical protein R3E54_00910 [Halioglobus sp.]
MASPERTCVECHGGIAHAPYDSVTAFAHRASHHATITLFSPGQSDSEWLTENHPGSQPLRQGANCQLCHRGEEVNMGRALASPATTSSRKVDIGFQRAGGNLAITLRWQGEADDSSVSLMWGTDSDESFRRGGCFAACHDDMQGMSKDRGQATGKYLWASRSQQQRLGQPAIIKDEEALAELMQAGAYAALWQVELTSGEARAATVLDRVKRASDTPLKADASFKDGWWRVSITQPLANQSPALLALDPSQRYTFGVALHGAANPGAAHWYRYPLPWALRVTTLILLCNRAMRNLCLRFAWLLSLLAGSVSAQDGDPQAVLSCHTASSDTAVHAIFNTFARRYRRRRKRGLHQLPRRQPGAPAGTLSQHAGCQLWPAVDVSPSDAQCRLPRVS